MSEWKYHIGPATAQMLRDEHGITETDLLGIKCLVGPDIPPGKAYMVVAPPQPPRQKIAWIALAGLHVKKEHCAVVVLDCS